MTRRRLLSGIVLGACLWFSPSQADEASDLAARLLATPSPLGDRTIGSATAPNVLIEYASASCSHCADFAINVLPKLKTEFIETGKLRLVFREMPLDKLSLGAFMLARCLPEEKYFPTMELMFRRQATWIKGNPAEELGRITQMAGMDKAAFDACLKRKDYAAIISQYAKVSAQDFGIKGTPTLFLNGTKLENYGSTENLAGVIASGLNP